MKKLISLLFIAAVFATNSFATITKTEGEIPSYSGISDVPFTYHDKRSYRLGGTGVALSEGVNALFVNPANLSTHKKFTLNLPQINFEVYGITNMMKDPAIKPYINQAIEQKSIKPIKDHIRDIVVAILSSTYYNYTYAPFFNFQTDVGFTVAGFGLDVFAQLNTNIYNLSGGSGRIELVPSASLGASLGFATKFDMTDSSKLSVGLSAAVIERAVADGARISDFSSSDSGFDSIIEVFKNKRVATGLLIPINIGATLSNGAFRVSAAYRNLDFSGRKMYNYCTISELVKNPFVGFNGNKSQAIGNLQFSSYSTFDIGLGINPKWRGMNPRIEADLIDVFNWKNTETADMSSIWSHLRLGAEISLINLVKVGAGLNQGRICFGARLDLFPVVIDIDYGWVESTPKLGEKLVDYISLQIKIGWDRIK